MNKIKKLFAKSIKYLPISKSKKEILLDQLQEEFYNSVNGGGKVFTDISDNTKHILYPSEYSDYKQ